MSNIQVQMSPTASPMENDSMDILFQIIDEDTYDLFLRNPQTNAFDELAEEEIKKIVEELRRFDKITEELPILRLLLEEPLKFDFDSNFLAKISGNYSIASPDSSRASISSLSDDDQDEVEEPFDLKEWMVEDPVTFRLRRPKLSEFLWLLLNNPRYHAYACWVNINEGTFKLRKPARVVSLWEQVKVRRTKRTMDFDTFSRAIRCQYKSGLMVKTHKKHTYRFT